MALKENDFIEINFTGRVKETGEVFDSTIEEELKKTGLAEQGIKAKPFQFALGKGMFLKSIDDFLIGKDFGKYQLELSPEQAFGKRESKLIQMIPLKFFKEHNINPVQGYTLNFDGRPGKILSSSGGRVLVDFNNPLAGKELIYEIEVLKKVEDLNDKIKALNDFFFRRQFDFEVLDKKVIFKLEKQLMQFVQMFQDKFKEILDLDVEIKEIETKESK